MKLNTFILKCLLQFSCMHQFGWLSERGGNFLNLLQKEQVPRKGTVYRGRFPQKRKLCTVSRVIILFYKGLTKNPEIGNTPVWVLANMLRQGQVMDAKLNMDFSNEMLLNTAKCQGYSFYRFRVIKGKPSLEEGGVGVEEG